LGENYAVACPAPSRAIFCTTLGGCGNFRTGDWLWWPGFDTVTAAYTYQIPVHDVALEVQCELYEFLEWEAKEHNVTPNLFNPGKGAGVSLLLQTDLSGSVQYVGIDLTKLGFPSLAALVTQTNKVPSLQAKALGKSTVSAQVDFAVAQTKNPSFRANCGQRQKELLKYEYLRLWLKEWLSQYKSYQAIKLGTSALNHLFAARR
jgi:hypothetical protein